MRQSKLESHLEASANIGSGFVISFFVWMLVVGPLVIAGYIDPVKPFDGFLVTLIFTITSYIRSFVWRRFFNAGLHRVIHNWMRKYYMTHKIKKPQDLNTGTVRVEMSLQDYLKKQFGSKNKALEAARASMNFDWDAYETAVETDDVSVELQAERDTLDVFVDADESVKQVLMDHIIYETWQNRP